MFNIKNINFINTLCYSYSQMFFSHLKQRNWMSLFFLIENHVDTVTQLVERPMWSSRCSLEFISISTFVLKNQCKCKQCTMLYKYLGTILFLQLSLLTFLIWKHNEERRWCNCVAIVRCNNTKYNTCTCTWVYVHVLALHIGLWSKVNRIGVMKGHRHLFLLLDD